MLESKKWRELTVRAFWGHFAKSDTHLIQNQRNFDGILVQPELPVEFRRRPGAGALNTHQSSGIIGVKNLLHKYSDSYSRRFTSPS